MKIALVQMPVTDQKAQNLEYAAKAVAQCAQNGARVAVLPEMFMCPYTNEYFVRFAEPQGDISWQALSRMAADNNIYVVGGSVPEQAGDRIYNTSYVFDPQGQQIARHRKVHLFDIDVKGGQFFKESDTFSAGNEVTTFDIDGITCGLCICFDIRFPELARLTALKGAQIYFSPGAFNMTTGPMHWELSFRMRAVDNQFYTVAVAPARDENGPYVSYANSLVCSPWAKVLVRADAAPEILYADLDMEEVQRVRQQLPLHNARRTDMYTLELV